MLENLSKRNPARYFRKIKSIVVHSVIWKIPSKDRLSYNLNYNSSIEIICLRVLSSLNKSNIKLEWCAGIWPAFPENVSGP